MFLPEVHSCQFDRVFDAAKVRAGSLGVPSANLREQIANQLPKSMAAYNLACSKQLRFASRARGGKGQRHEEHHSPSLEPVDHCLESVLVTRHLVEVVNAVQANAVSLDRAA